MHPTAPKAHQRGGTSNADEKFQFYDCTSSTTTTTPRGAIEAEARHGRPCRTKQRETPRATKTFPSTHNTYLKEMWGTPSPLHRARSQASALYSAPYHPSRSGECTLRQRSWGPKTRLPRSRSGGAHSRGHAARRRGGTPGGDRSLGGSSHEAGATTVPTTKGGTRRGDKPLPNPQRRMGAQSGNH